VDRPISPTADATQPAPERPIETCLGLNLRLDVFDLGFLARRFRIPEIDVKTLDLFNEQEDRLSRRAKVVIAVRIETCAPRAELLDLGLVQTIAQRSPLGSGSSVRRRRARKNDPSQCDANWTVLQSRDWIRPRSRPTGGSSSEAVQFSACDFEASGEAIDDAVVRFSGSLEPDE
jgi:hypothetical protein